MNQHRINWRRLPGDKGRTCGACGEVAANVAAQLLHADLFEPRAYLQSRSLTAPMSPGERLLRDIFTNQLEES